MRTRPVVGITRCSKLDDYVRSVEQAGGLPRVLEFGESPDAVLSEVDAVLLTGGGDVDPALYGALRHPTVQDAEPGRDAFEIELTRRAMEADVPLLAICRGAQVLNVAAGGTLVQDIPSSVTSDLAHTQPDPTAHCHDIAVTPGTRLAATLGAHLESACACRVNSRHHQSVGRLGDGLVASATAPDGVIEAIEMPSSHFCIGVQWHPENFWQTGEFAPLFEAFVAAARERLDRRKRADRGT